MARQGKFKLSDNKGRKWNEGKKYWEGKIDIDGNEIHILCTPNEMQRMITRAKKNPEDIRKDSWLVDLLD